ncbi:MAG: hypothetical protein QM820_40345 [Minicystis sp.]
MDHRFRTSLKARTLAPFAAMAALSIGCAALPKTGVEANGQPLLADVKTEDIQYVAKVKSGEVVHKDASGNVIGTSEAYEDKLMSATITTWATFQGEDKIDDEDFFRISGDTQASDQIPRGPRARGHREPRRLRHPRRGHRPERRRRRHLRDGEGQGRGPVRPE